MKQKKHIAEDLQKTTEKWETYSEMSLFYKGKSEAFKEALESLRVFEKES